MISALVHIAKKPNRWVRALEAAYDARAAAAANGTVAAEAWAPSPCACSSPRGSAARRSFGHYRAVRWWLHAFIADSGATRMPATLTWPRAAQLEVPRRAGAPTPAATRASPRAARSARATDGSAFSTATAPLSHFLSDRL